MEISPSIALLQAVSDDNAEEVRRLLESGTPIAAHPKHGNTPLRTACQASALKALAVLLSQGANPNERITYRSNVDGRVDEEFTPLMYASDPGAIEMLVNHGADVNSVSATGLSPLMRFSHYGNARAVKALLAHGADPNLRKPKGEARSALEMCEQSLKFWESLPKEDLKQEAEQVIEEHRETLAMLRRACAS